MRTLSFRISEKNFERLTELQEKWNKSDARTPEVQPYTKTDIINMCICLIWETEFTLGINSERKEIVKENFSE